MRTSQLKMCGNMKKAHYLAQVIIFMGHLHEVVPKRYKSRFTHEDMEGTWPKDQDTVLQNSSVRKVTRVDNRTQEKVTQLESSTDRRPDLGKSDVEGQ